MAELIHKPASLSFKPIAAKHFYAIIATSTLIGIGLDLTGIDAIKALLWSAVINGVTAVPLMFALMHMASKQEVMGSFTVEGNAKRLGWIATLLMTVAAVVLIAVNINL